MQQQDAEAQAYPTSLPLVPQKVEGLWGSRALRQGEARLALQDP